MKKDPIVEEVRAIRDQQAKAFGYDIKKIVADAMRKQKKSSHRLVPLAKPKGKRKDRAQDETTPPIG